MRRHKRLPVCRSGARLPSQSWRGRRRRSSARANVAQAPSSDKSSPVVAQVVAKRRRFADCRRQDGCRSSREGRPQVKRMGNVAIAGFVAWIFASVAWGQDSGLTLTQDNPLMRLVAAADWQRFGVIHEMVTDPSKMPTEEIRNLTAQSPFKHLFKGSKVSAAALEFILLKRDGRSVDAATTPRSRPNVVLVSISGLRGDRVSGSAASQLVAPRLDRLAREGVSFRKALAPAPWSPPSQVSLLTSLYPSYHGVEWYQGKDGPRLAANEPRLAVSLEQAGYRTAAMWADPAYRLRLGWERGFDTYEILRANAAVLVQRAMLWLEWQEFLTVRGLSDEPTFLMLQLADLGAPFTAPEAYVRAVAGAAAEVPSLDGEPIHGSAHERLLYDAEVRFVDDQIGLLCDALVRLGRWGDTLFVATSDHGYSLGERGAAATGLNLHDEFLHVPLVFSLPTQLAAEQQSSIVVTLLDVMPTVLDFVGVERPGSLQGRTLRPLMSTLTTPATGEVAQQVIFAELGPLEGEWAQPLRGKTIRTNRYKLIFERDAKGQRTKKIYRVIQDPGEGNDVYIEVTTDPDVANLERTLRGFARAGALYSSETPPPTPDVALLERLRSLGYEE